MNQAGAPQRYLFYVEDNYCFSILRPIENVIRARGDEVVWLPVGEDIDRQAFTDTERVFDYVQEAISWQPKAVLVPGNQVPAFIPGIKATMFHGLISAKQRRNGDNYHFIYRGVFDLYCTHGPNTTKRFKELALQYCDFEVIETGFSKLDPLFDGSVKPAQTNPDRPTIYFASTFSKRLSAAPVLVDTIAELANRHDWQWLINFHPKMDPSVVDCYRAIESANLKVVDTHDVTPLLLGADVMLCDTSSIISEFALLKKPVVTFRNLRPESYLLNVTDPTEIGPALQRALARPDDLIQAIEQRAMLTHPYFDGHSSERTLEAIDELAARGASHLRPKPRNVVRHLKMRRQLNYFRF